MFSSVLLISKYMLLAFYSFFKNLCFLIFGFFSDEYHEKNINVPLVIGGTQFDKSYSGVYSNT